MVIWELLELELLEEMIISLFLMFFAVALSLVMIKIRDYLSGEMITPYRDSFSPVSVRLQRR